MKKTICSILVLALLLFGQPVLGDDFMLLPPAASAAGVARYFAGPLFTNNIDWGASVLSITGDLSIGMWIKLDAASEGFLISNTARFYDWPYSLYVSGSSGSWNITYRHTNGSDYNIEFTAALLNDKWYYIGISRDTSISTVTMYLGQEDGTFTTVGSGTYAAPPANSGIFDPPHLYIGNAITGDGFNHYLEGTVQEQYMWSRAISSAEHQAAMGGSPSATNLVLSCAMGNNPEVDTSPSGLTGVVTGTTLVRGHQ